MLSQAISIEEIATLLLRVASVTSYQQCLQSRDRVYGILGLLDRTKIEASVVNFYSCASVTELCTQFSAFLLTNALYVPIQRLISECG